MRILLARASMCTLGVIYIRLSGGYWFPLVYTEILGRKVAILDQDRDEGAMRLQHGKRLIVCICPARPLQPSSLWLPRAYALVHVHDY